MAESAPSSAPSSASPPPFPITVLISGYGSNLQELIDRASTPALPKVRFVRVVSDRKAAHGLQRAQTAGIPTTYHGIVPYQKRFPHVAAAAAASTKETTSAARQAFDADLATLVLADAPRLVVCAGFMRILTPAFLDPLAAAGVPIINLHPSLYGDLVGADCIARAWDEFVAGRRAATGVMVHYVIAEVDRGEMILQQEVDMRGCESLDELKARIGRVEKSVIVAATATVVDKARSSAAR